jgi:WD40 repeat protein/predicted  nucleic acid-binding Zn-ribbon protein
VEPVTTFLTATVAGNLVMGCLGNLAYDLSLSRVAGFWDRMNLGNHDLQRALQEAYRSTLATIELLMAPRRGVQGLLRKLAPAQRAERELADDFSDKLLTPFLERHAIEGKRRDAFLRASRGAAQHLQGQAEAVMQADRLVEGEVGPARAPLANADARQTFSLIESILFTGQDLAPARVEAAGGAAVSRAFGGTGLPEALFYALLKEQGLFLNGLVFHLDIAIKNNQKVANILQEYRSQQHQVSREAEKGRRDEERRQLGEKLDRLERAVLAAGTRGDDVAELRRQQQALLDESRRLDERTSRAESWLELHVTLKRQIESYSESLGTLQPLVEQLAGKVDEVLAELHKLEEGIREVADTTRETQATVSGMAEKVDFILDLLKGFRQDTALSDPVRESLMAGLEPAGSFDLHSLYDFREDREHELGRGAVGVVYRAVHRGTGEPCALKMLKQEFRENPTVVARFLREAAVLKGVDHPNIVRVDEAGGGGSGLSFYIHMELLSGASLRQLVDDKALPRDWPSLLTMTCQLLGALEAVHRNGIIHRDINPNNVMRTSEGTLKLMDFGVARIAGLSGLTLQGEVVGTSRYMSPEQERGEPVDQRSDIYSLGLVLYEVYTQRRPSKPPKPLRFYNPEVPEWVEPLIGRCLAPDRQQRFSSISKLIRAFEGEGADPADVERYRDNVLVFLEDGRLSPGERKMLGRLRDELELPESLCDRIEAEARSGIEPGRPTPPSPAPPPAPLPEPPALSAAPATIRPLEVVPSPYREWRQLACLGSAVGHRGAVSAVAVTDPARALSTGTDGTVRTWDLSSGAELESVAAPTLALSAIVAVSRDRRTLACAIGTGQIRLLNAETGKVSGTLEGHSGPVLAVATVGGDRLVSGGQDAVVRLWSLAEARLLRALEGHSGAVHSVAGSADGRYVASGGADRTARVWSVDGAEMTELRRLEMAAPVQAVCLSPDNARLYAAEPSRFVAVWDVTSGSLLERFEAHGGSIGSLVVSADGRYLITAGSDGLVKAWSAETGSLVRELRGHTAAATRAAVSDDGGIVVSGGDDCAVRAWNLGDGCERWSLSGHTGPIQAVAVASDASRIVSASRDKTLRVWDPAGGELGRLQGEALGTRCLAFAAGGELVAVGSAVGNVVVFSLGSGEPVGQVQPGPHVLHVGFGPEPNLLLVVTARGAITVWDWETGKLQETIETGGPARVACHSADGTRLFVGGQDRKLRLWERSARQPSLTLIGHSTAPSCIALSSDNRVAASGDNSGGIFVWDAATGDRLRMMSGHQGPVTCLSVLPGNRHLVSAGSDATIRFWDLSSGAQQASLEGHDQAVLALAVAASGDRIVSGGVDKTIRVWGSA